MGLLLLPPKPLSLEDIKLMEVACRIVADTLTLVSKHVKPGIETIELDAIAEDFIYSKGANPTFKNYNGFPNALCISIDDEIVHGIPSHRKLQEGQIVSIDCGADIKGFVGDSAITCPVGDISVEKQRLLRVTEESLFKGIEKATHKGRVFDISRAIQVYCEDNGYSLTKELTGHGIGRKLHMPPSVPNFVPSLLRKRTMPNEKLVNGIGLAIEPMVHMGNEECFVAADGQTVLTRDKSPAAHFEHTVIVNNNAPIILTLRN